MYNNIDDNFFGKITKYPILPANVQIELIKKARTNDIDARDTLILSNSKLILKIAKEFLASEIPLNDLFMVGVKGIISAIKLYDETKNNKFSYYAAIWIKHEIKRYIVNNSKVIRIPSHLYQILIITQKIKNEYYKEYGTYPTDEYLINQYNQTNYNAKINLQSYQKLKLYSADIMSLNDNFAEKNNSFDEEIENFITDKETPLIEDEIISNFNQKFLEDILDGTINSPLNERERFVLAKHFGFGNHEPATLEKIGKELNLTKQRVSYLQIRALKKLRNWDIFQECYLEYFEKEKKLEKTKE